MVSLSSPMTRASSSLRISPLCWWSSPGTIAAKRKHYTMLSPASRPWLRSTTAHNCPQPTNRCSFTGSRAPPKSRRDQWPQPFPDNRKTHSPIASAAAFCIPARRASGCPLKLPWSSPAMSPHSTGSSCTRTPSPAAHLPATTSSANRSPPALPDLEICPPSQSSSSADVPINPQPARCTALRSEYLLPPLNVADFPRSETTLRQASAIPPRSAPRPRPLRRSSFDSPHVRPEQSTIPLRSATHVLRLLGSVIWDAHSACHRRKSPMCIGTPSDVNAKSAAAGIPYPLQSSSVLSTNAQARISQPHPDGFPSLAVPIAADRRAAPASWPLATPPAHPQATSAQPHR